MDNKRNSRDTEGSLQDLEILDVFSFYDNLDCSQIEKYKNEILGLQQLLFISLDFVKKYKENIIDIKNRHKVIIQIDKINQKNLPLDRYNISQNVLNEEIRMLRFNVNEYEKEIEKEKKECKKIKKKLEQCQEQYQSCLVKRKLKSVKFGRMKKPSDKKKRVIKKKN